MRTPKPRTFVYREKIDHEASRAAARKHATKRGITQSELCRRIVNAVLADDIVDAVLDDIKGARK